MSTMGGYMTEDMLTLELVNMIRDLSEHQALNELPKGSIRDANNCSVANALKDIDPEVFVYKEGIFSKNISFIRLVAKAFGHKHGLIRWEMPGVIRYGVPVPMPMGYFIDDFDKGCYPELVSA